ncbi:sugar-phosphatase [Enterococcus columbae]|uniref:HAD superfamily hydrolase n=1 Tax=Enterococcus columbae DSM 7374 = ATCC 51263 TaxID=1121865 RepID=S1N5F4_9ENTE|nr:sugar-phosphatase [Enterococcus columbae]EOT44942.1 HAD superfamily hydrolase [Enterococcus columbae DSM 7374 = ATCC 51263]EOW84235.1 HAD superfamily hydrolase [Enterococcus columbae DSM 7374 = ATCC 51263]OJG24986.1 HAD superfamily hydrolase [Enterococcus columbae DSM 7374 = ATCC 51263]
MSIKLIAIDIDGTLINNQHQITPEVKEALQAAKAQGVKVVLCTGRPLPGVLNYLNELDLFSGEDYVISYNGSLVQNTSTKEIVSQHGLTLADYNDLEYLSRKIGVHLHATTEDTMFTANRDISPHTVREAYLVNMPVKYRTPAEMGEELNIIKIMMIDDEEILDAGIKQIPQEYFERFTIVKSSPYFLEILNKNVNKGIALESLAQFLNLSADEVMAIGDNENDLPMINYAGIGVAMGNATDNVKKHADVITASNEEHGVAQAVKKYVLK